jgi:Lipocalin-like domain
MSQDSAKLIGSWKLVSFVGEIKDSTERTHPFGANPNGYLLISADGRMMAVLTARERKAGTTEAEQAALLRTMVAYTGHYRIEGERFVTKVDTSWNESWNGTEQERFFKIEGEQLELTTAWAPHPTMPSSPVVRGILTWTREA